MKLTYIKSDKRYIFLKGDHKEMEALTKYLNKIPSFMFLPSFAGVPKPEVFLNKFLSKTGEVIYYCHSGLWRTIVDWCGANHIEINAPDDEFKYTGFNLSLDDFKKLVMGWNLTPEPREYQIKAAWKILHYRQSLSSLATRSGKTLIFNIIARYMLSEMGARKILMVVPSIQLVKQGVEDLKSYNTYFTSETVWAKSELVEGSNLTIGTYQSLVQRADRRNKKYDPKWFDQFDVVCVDEAHHLVCESINKILSLDFMKRVKLRFGFTGTLPKEHTIDSFCCHSLMGPTIQKISTSQLVEEGYLAAPNITQIHIAHPMNPTLLAQYIECGEYLCGNDKEVDGKKVLLPKDQQCFTKKYEKTLPFAMEEARKTMTNEEYMDYLVDSCKAKGSSLLMLEQMLLHRDPRRLQLITQIISGIDKNVILFAHHTEYLRYIYKYLKEQFPSRPVYLIVGATNLKARQASIDKMVGDDNAILCASYGVCSTGITFKNVDYGILAQSFKSEIVNMQSIGRGLLKTSSKDKFIIYDLVDIFPTGRLAAHGKAKQSTYKAEKYQFHTTKF